MVGHHRGQGYADGLVPFFFAHNLGYHRGYLMWRGRLWGGDLQPWAHEFTVIEVDFGALNAGAADIDAK